MSEVAVRPRLSWPVAAVLGVVAVGAALGVGQLVAGFVGPTSSPFIAVGDAAIDRTPAWLKDWAIQNFGSNDKTVLLWGMAVVLLLFGVLAGLVSRRTPLPGTLLAVALGVLGVVAVSGRSDLGQLGVLAPVASTVAGAWVFWGLHRLALRAASAPPTEFELAGENRRRFLYTTAGVAVGAGVAGLAGQLVANAGNVEGSRDAVGALVPVTPTVVPPGADFASSGTPSFITNASDFYRVDTALTVPQVSTAEWSLRIHGMVDREVRFSYADIRNRQLVEEIITLCCVSNPVGGPYISTAKFIGVPLFQLLNEAGVHADADQLLSTSVDGFTAGTPVDTVLDPNRGALLAIGMNGQPLPIEHGFPARLVVPGLYGYVSATKWVTDLELTTFAAKQAYWVPRGWSVRGPIKTESRIDFPAAFGQLPHGSVTVAGIAWAQTKGIAKVEIQVDNGPWQPAQLSTEVTKNAWRMWRASVNLGPGQHTVRARATDDTGYTQTDQQADVIPDGATGYPSTTFTVT